MALTEQDNIDVKRLLNGLKFDSEWNKHHIPTADRLIKIAGKYAIEKCPHCIKLGLE
jgi:hypothetical protein